MGDFSSNDTTTMTGEEYYPPWDEGWDYSTGKDPYGYPAGSIDYNEFGDPIAFMTGHPSTKIWDTYYGFIPALSVISIFLSLVTIIIYFLMRKYMPQVANRVSLRLVALIAAADITYNASWFAMMYGYNMTGSTCKATGFFVIASGLASVFMTLAIGLNIFLVFVIKLGPRAAYEKAYIVCALGFSLLLPTIALATDQYGYNGYECWFRGDSNMEILANAWYFFYGWIFASCALCGVFVLMFWIVLRRNQRQLESAVGAWDSGTSGNGKERKKASKKEKMINRTVARVSWYCVVPIASQVFNLGYDIALRTGNFDYFCIYLTCITLTYLSVLLASLQGTFNAFIFLVADPTVAQAREALRQHFVKKHYLRYIPVESHSKSPAASHAGTEFAATLASVGNLIPTDAEHGASIAEGPNTSYEHFMFTVTKICFLRTADTKSRKSEMRSHDGSKLKTNVLSTTESQSRVTDGTGSHIRTIEKAEAVAFL